MAKHTYAPILNTPPGFTSKKPHRLGPVLQNKKPGRGGREKIASFTLADSVAQDYASSCRGAKGLTYTAWLIEQVTGCLLLGAHMKKGLLGTFEAELALFTRTESHPAQLGVQENSFFAPLSERRGMKKSWALLAAPRGFVFWWATLPRAQNHLAC